MGRAVERAVTRAVERAVTRAVERAVTRAVERGLWKRTALRVDAQVLVESGQRWPTVRVEGQRSAWKGGRSAAAHLVRRDGDAARQVGDPSKAAEVAAVARPAVGAAVQHAVDVGVGGGDDLDGSERAAKVS